jgi:hypothetical protein
MSNLSELLPTGGGQNAVDFVASGTLASGQTVILRSDGKVEAVAEVSVVGSLAVFESANSNNISATYNSTNNKIVIAYTDNGNSAYGTAVVGTVSGTSISFGSPTVFESANSNNISATYNSTNNKIVIAYADNGNSGYGTAKVGTVSGTSISFGSPTVYNSASSWHNKTTYDSTNNKIVVAYRDFGNSSYGTAKVGTISGTSISFGSPTVFESAPVAYVPITYNSTNNKIVITYTDFGNSSYGTAIVGTVSGTSISFGSPTVYNSASTVYQDVTYDSTNNKIVVAYRDGGNSSYGTAKVGTISGTSISFGSATVYVSASLDSDPSVTHDVANNKTIIFYPNSGNSNRGTAIAGTISGTSISFGSPTVFGPPNSFSNSATYNSTNGIVVNAFEGSSSYGTAVTYQPGSTNSADFIGITAEAISNTATGAVNVYGGINEAQTGLTIGSDYYVQNDGSISTTSSAVKIGQAISATTINMMDLT